jgi:hypothetical protein
MRTGAWPSGLALPSTLGVEAAGVVQAVGQDVTDFARAGSPLALMAVSDGGRLVSITDPPPEPERGIDVTYHAVRPDGRQLSLLARQAGHGVLRPPAVRAFTLENADDALSAVRAGSHGAAVALLT